MKKFLKFLWDLYWELTHPKAKERRHQLREGDGGKER